MSIQGPQLPAGLDAATRPDVTSVPNRPEDAEGIRQAARAFEAIFIERLFREMRGAYQSQESDLSTSVYQSMFDTAVAEGASQQGGIGLAAIIERAWGLDGSEAGEGGGVTGVGAPPLALAARANAYARWNRVTPGAELDPAGIRAPGMPPLELERSATGMVQPYAMNRVFGHFHDIRSSGREHGGLDLGGVGPRAGLGEPIRAMTTSRVVALARPEDDPVRYGRPDYRDGTEVRGGRELPRSEVVPGYGRVHYFTEDYGTARTGTMVVTEVVGGPLDGHRVRYMHLGAIHPDLRVGDVLQPGQELGLMGSTAILEDSPHLHLDITDPGGSRVDPAPWLASPR